MGKSVCRAVARVAFVDAVEYSMDVSSVRTSDVPLLSQAGDAEQISPLRLAG